MSDVVIRPLERGDGPALTFVFGRLSERSRQQRFLVAKRRLSDSDLARLTAVDHWHHEALIAFSPRPRAPIAVARYVRADEFDVGEIAVTVVDAWQRRGVGAALTDALAERAVRAGIRRFRATLLRGNGGALALVRRIGPPTTVAGHGEVVELVLPIQSSTASRNSHPAVALPA
jgi:GNAT superfamily N-acetyltransferase